MHKLLTKYAHNRPDVDARLKAAHESMRDGVATATKEVEKQYRKKAKLMHPDKMGEDSQSKFELLTAARDVLKDPTLRHLYIREMVGVVHKLGETFIPQSHQAWVAKNQPDCVTSNVTRLRNLKPSQQQKIQLEGGLLFQKPRIPHIVICDAEARLVHVSLPILKPEYQFYQYIHRIDITFTSPNLISSNKHNKNKYNRNNNNGSTTTHKLSLTRSQITSQIIQNSYPSTINAGKTTLPNEGSWYVSWTATMQDVTDDPNHFKNNHDNNTRSFQTSPPSSEASIQIASQETLKRRVQTIEEEHNAGRAINRIDSAMSKLKGHTGVFSTSTAQYNVLHSAIVRARGVERRLVYLLKITGELPDDEDDISISEGLKPVTNKPYSDLHQKIQSCAPTMLHLQNSRRVEVKKDALKMFKHHIATILENNSDVVRWIRNIKEKDLKKHGGDANRLYQLFVEGKGKAFVLQLDSDLLEAASERNDLFTVRQCKDLFLRGSAVKLCEEGDEKEILAETARLEKERDEEEKMAQKAKLSLVGATVKFRGLQTENGRKLNGKLGKVKEYLEGSKENGGGDRYKVEYIGDVNGVAMRTGGDGSIPKGKVFSVKAENLEANNSCYLESTSKSTSTSTSTETPIIPAAAIVVNSTNIEEVIEGIMSGSIGGDAKTNASQGVISGIITGTVVSETEEGKTKAPPQDAPQRKLQRQRQKKEKQQEPLPQSQAKDLHQGRPKMTKPILMSLPHPHRLPTTRRTKTKTKILA